MFFFLLACAGPDTTGQDGLALDFTLNDADGVAHSLSDYSGDVVVLDLSAFW